MTSRHHLTAVLAAAVLLVLTAAPTQAAPSKLWVVDGATVRSVDNAGALAGDDPLATRSGLVASAARDTKKKTSKKKKRSKQYDNKAIRRAINKLGGAPNRKLDARAALADADRAWRKAPRNSQAKRELEMVLRNTTKMARGNRITKGRLLMLTETLNRNAEWWSKRKPTGSGQRISFDGSQLVWQYYPGAGMQIQWLGTFGSGNGLYYSGKAARPKLRELLDEATRLAVPRAGGIAWEYFFPFGGGSPPWASGMAQATGIQVFSRAAGEKSLNDPQLLATAKDALPLLEASPPTGVQVDDTTGAHYLIYSFSSAKVLNAMTQTVNGLYAYVLAAPDDVDGRLLLLNGLRWLDANVDRYDTGKWSLYQLGGSDANAHYHALARDFLKTLCHLLNNDVRTPGGGPSGAFPSERFCNAADRFTRYIKNKS